MQRLVWVLGIISMFVTVFQCRSLAEPRGSFCVISQVQSGALIADRGLPTKLESFPRDAFIAVKCSGNDRKNTSGAFNSRGTLHMSIGQSSTRNGSAQIRIVGGSGIFSNISASEYGTDLITVSYNFNGSSPQEGRLFYQVRVVAPGRAWLHASGDYSVSVQARLQ
jgi:hypothetical protein